MPCHKLFESQENATIPFGLIAQTCDYQATTYPNITNENIFSFQIPNKQWNETCFYTHFIGWFNLHRLRIVSNSLKATLMTKTATQTRPSRCPPKSFADIVLVAKKSVLYLTSRSHLFSLSDHFVTLRFPSKPGHHNALRAHI